MTAALRRARDFVLDALWLIPLIVLWLFGVFVEDEDGGNRC